MGTKDLELLKRIENGGDIYASDTHGCIVICPECPKNGKCELQKNEGLRNVSKI